MATVKYLIHETPNPKGDAKKMYHARPEGGRIIKLEALCSEISSMSSFSSADVKGLLEAFSSTLKLHLNLGHSVELDGIGLFSVSISCPKNIEDPKKINSTLLRFKKVNFKSNARLNKELRSMMFEHSKEDNRGKTYTEDERHRRILNFIKSEGSIQSSVCMGLNNCTRYIALKDLDRLMKTGKIIHRGTSVMSI